MKPLSETKEDIQKILEKHGAALGYVFGSYAQGKEAPLSDVDTAVVFSQSMPKNEHFDRELAIAHDIGQLLEIDRVDVVNLEAVTSPLLKHRAAIRGICVLDTDHTRRLTVERQTLREYEDTRYLRAVQAQLMRGQLQRGTFGKPLISSYAYGTS